MNEYYRNKLFKCSKSSETVYEQSECVFAIIDEFDARLKQPKKHGNRLEVLNLHLQPTINYTLPKNFYHPSDAAIKQAVQYRTKREVIRQQNYKLHTQMENITPVGIIGKFLSQFVHRIKNKKMQSFSTTLAELSKKQKIIQEKKKFREQLKKKFDYAQHGASHIIKKTKLTKAEKQLVDELKMPDDLVDSIKLNNDIKSKQIMETMQLLRSGIRLAARIAKNNDTEALSDDKLKFASPRFFSVVPEDNEKQLSLLSPSLFSLHNEGKGLEALLSLPGLMNSIDNSDYKEWLNFIIEASGVTDTLEMLKEEPEGVLFGVDRETAPRGIDGQPMYLTKDNLTEIGGLNEYKKAVIMEEMQKMLVKDQFEQFNEDGYSVLTNEQLDLIYGSDSPYANPTALKRFKSLSKNEILALLEANLRSLGKAKTAEQQRRKRDVVLSPVMLEWINNDPQGTSQPFILSPVVFTLASFSPAVLGPVILTPWLFVTVLLAPRVLCPVIVSPVALSAIILSPLVFDPLILSPAALVAFVLSPIVLSPNILTPNVLVPVILSPLALSPNILTPNAVNAIVLSPFVLNPAIFSPSYVSTLVLSPHALSPLINSTGKGVSLVLSPSTLS